MNAAPANQRHDSARSDLFAVAASRRAAEIARYKANSALPAPVMLSLRSDPNAKIRWPAKF